MKNILKKHIGLIVLLVLILAFPASMSTQARLNMRVIITGLAIDKTDEGYEVTAQIVKPSPSSESSGTGASINFISDKGETIVSALSKLSYKSGKVAGFSHTNFILLGKELINENVSQILDYFLRDTIIKDSVLLLVAKDSAKEEIKKTKDVELSVGLGLQKVFVYKEKESDGTMTSLLNFVNSSYGHSKTALTSILSFTDESGQSGESAAQSQTKQSPGEGSAEQGTSSGSESGSSGAEGGSVSGSEQSSSKSGEQQSSSESSGSEQKSQYFEAITPLACFVSGKLVGMLESKEEVLGYMYASNKCQAEDISLENISFGKLTNAKVGIDVKNKTNKKKIRFEGETPCLDIYVNITNASIKEIQSEEFVKNPTNEEFEFIKKNIKEKISETIALTFEKSKQLGADVFGAFDIANKFHYKTIKNKFQTMEEFINELKLNVIVNISRLEF